VLDWDNNTLGEHVNLSKNLFFKRDRFLEIGHWNNYSTRRFDVWCLVSGVCHPDTNRRYKYVFPSK
jgi:hypothetical protein